MTIAEAIVWVAAILVFGPFVAIGALMLGTLAAAWITIGAMEAVAWVQHKLWRRRLAASVRKDIARSTTNSNATTRADR